MSPNPNTIAIANGFHTDLSKVMLEGSLPAIVAIVITFFIAHKLRDKGDTIHKNALNLANDNLRSEEHTSELQSRQYLVCRLLLEKKKKIQNTQMSIQNY